MWGSGTGRAEICQTEERLEEEKGNALGREGVWMPGGLGAGGGRGACRGVSCPV